MSDEARDRSSSDLDAPTSTGTGGRPRPAYGEYAPEGWSWKPEGAETLGRDSGESAPGGAPAGGPPSSGRVPGVPHNLGVSGEGGSSQTPPPAQRLPASSEPSQTPDQRNAYVGEVQRPSPASGGRAADRVITILLLVVGAGGALMLANSLMQIGPSLLLMGDALGLDGMHLPSWVATMGTVGAIFMLGLYAVVLIMSIQRLRARKITFFIPLIAGVLAFIIAIALSAVAITAAPELIQRFTEDPNAVTDVMESLSAPQ